MTKNKISAVDHIIPNSVINSKFETGIVTACTSDDFLVIYRYLFLGNNLIRNNITRSLNIFGINKIYVSYCLLSNISALLSKSHF